MQLDDFDASEALSKSWIDIELEEKIAEIEELESRIQRLTDQRDKWADKYLNLLLSRNKQYI